MIRGFEDAAESTSALNRATSGLLVLGNRTEMASQLEQALLRAGALVVRTRVPVSPSLVLIARLGAVVLVESDVTGPITFIPVHGLHTVPQELAFDEPDEIFNEIQRLGAFPTGDADNDNGLGI